ncbi:hypothetical protein HFP15_02830 [Amycolatopsis sp. K13G38]|uniref:DUF1990 domain-containing protein n=1 Tax=Amycolatopsis acididurans TaxID=2724524 RepID=A0ABX1IWE5_9PSEU|nr:hypothetical protein [Amycolatopsis acididurans]NKQ51812.1 hypothetical protein [Amycolatopsis acididurans]
MSTTETARTLLADTYAPRYDVMQTRHLIVEAAPERAYRAVRALDFTEVGGGIVGAAFRVRGLAERWHNRHDKTPRVPPRLTFDDMSAGSDWVILGEHPGVEIAAGVGGRFWKPVVEWRRIAPEEFASFSEPGYGKIVFSLSVTPYGDTRSLLTYDIRVSTTDTASRVKFRAYWTVVSPFVAAVQNATLRAAASRAEHPGE